MEDKVIDRYIMSSEQLARIIAGAEVSAAWINAVAGGDLSWFVPDDISLYGNLTQATINKHMQNNINHIVQALAQQDVIDHSSDKTALNNAVTTGNQYITDNS
tara:strand:+ start:1694 stop:2002 length:309 start_codon:yes stop_codon:yes gene_type:complete